MAPGPYRVSRAKADAQFEWMRRACAAADPPIRIAHLTHGEGDIDYFYEVDVILVRSSFVLDVQRVLFDKFGARCEPIPRGPFEALTLLSITATRAGVPRVLEVIDRWWRTHAPPDGPPVIATPHHVLSVADPKPVTNCAATEPKPVKATTLPVPDVCKADQDGAGVRVCVADTGLVAGATAHAWLHGVTGDPDPVYNGKIVPYDGHGTFIVGVTRCMAPAANVTVKRVFKHAGAGLELDVAEQLVAVLADDPAVVVLSAGATTRDDLAPLGFEPFWEQLQQRGGKTVLVAAAGNNGSDRAFWPGAVQDPKVISVGALKVNQRQRVRWSNFGPWVKVYVRGERLVNAFATGTYIYREPANKHHAPEHFKGMARWSGTSFSAPLVAGLIAARMSRRGQGALEAAQALLEQAEAQRLDHVGPVLFPCLDNNAEG